MKSGKFKVLVKFTFNLSIIFLFSQYIGYCSCTKVDKEETNIDDETSLSASISGTASAQIVEPIEGSLAGSLANLSAAMVSSPAGCSSSPFNVFILGAGSSPVYKGITDESGKFAIENIPENKEALIVFSCAAPISNYLSEMKCLGKDNMTNLICDPVSNAAVRALESIFGGPLEENTSLYKIYEMSEFLTDKAAIFIDEIKNDTNLIALIETAQTAEELKTAFENSTNTAVTIAFSDMKNSVNTVLYPVLESLTLSGTLTQGMPITITWNVPNKTNIYGFVVGLVSDFDASTASSTSQIESIYISMNSSGIILPSESSYTFTMPPAYGGNYYVYFSILDMQGNSISFLSDSRISTTNYTIVHTAGDQINQYYASTIPLASLTVGANSYTCGDGNISPPEECETITIGCNTSCKFEPPTSGTCNSASLQSISISNAALDLNTSENVIITVVADFSCAKYIGVNLTGPANETEYINLTHAGVGVFSGQFPKSKYNMDGTWTVTDVFVYDADNIEHTFIHNGAEYIYNGSTATGTTFAPSVVITNSLIDNVLPLLTALAVEGTPTGTNGTNYQLGDVITVTSTASDADSGIMGVFIDIVDSESSQNVYGSCFALNLGNGTCICDIVLSGFGDTSPVTLYPKLMVMDNARNVSEYVFEPATYSQNYLNFASQQVSTVPITFIIMDVNPQP
ncbi:MAG: hypothetical protein OEZ22_06380 [Spirochaetia bacterium]|nr:hypothetical protein [Spirochaetia bacterium]